MIPVETIIRKLVSDLEFVIIPGFGALLSHQVPAVYNRDSGIYTPPVKKLAFNEFLKLDDGLLANFISREEQISHLDAVAHIRSYVSDLKSALQSKGYTSIEGIGNFKMNGEGKLVFEPGRGSCFKDEWYGFTKIAAAVTEKSFKELSLQKLASVQSESYFTSDLKRGSLIRWGAAAVLTGFMFFVSIFLMTSGKERNKSTLNPFDGFLLNQSEVKQNLVSPELKAIDKTVVKKSVSSGTIAKPVVVSPAVSNSVKPNVVPTADKPVFYVIAGTFKGMKQAKVLLAEMQNKGYKDAVIIPSGKHSKKVKVAVEGYNRQKEAYQASLKLKNVIGENGWVVKNI